MIDHDKVRAGIAKKVDKLNGYSWDLQANQAMLRQFLNAVAGQTVMPEHGPMVRQFVGAMIESAMVAVRTFDDSSNRSISIVRIINLIIHNIKSYDRKWYVSAHHLSQRGRAEIHFNSLCDPLKTSILSRKLLEQDRDNFIIRVKNIRHIVNKRVAHNSEAEQVTIPKVTINEMIESIDYAFDLVKKYSRLTTQASVDSYMPKYQSSLMLFADTFFFPEKTLI